MTKLRHIGQHMSMAEACITDLRSAKAVLATKMADAQLNPPKSVAVTVTAGAYARIEAELKEQQQNTNLTAWYQTNYMAYLKNLNCVHYIVKHRASI